MVDSFELGDEHSVPLRSQRSSWPAERLSTAQEDSNKIRQFEE